MSFFADYEDENGCGLDIEIDDPRYDEFYTVSFDIIETIKAGHRRYQDTLSIDYRDFPSRITDADTGAPIYPVAVLT